MSRNKKKTYEDVKRIKKHTEVLVSLLYELEAKYALVEPMIFDDDLVKEFNNKRYAASAFNRLRIALYFDCIKDSSRLYHDSYETSPSVTKVLEIISNRLVHQNLRLEFSNWKKELSKKAGVSFSSDDAEVKRLESEFDNIYRRTKEVSKNLMKSDLLAKIRKARNKVIAHTDIKQTSGEFHRISIDDIGIKWGDVEEFIGSTRGLVFDLALLVNNTNYADSRFREVHVKASQDFWAIKTTESIQRISDAAAD